MMPQPHLNRPFFLLVRWIIKRLCRIYFLLTNRLIVEGRQHLPHRRTPTILICNHPSLFDSVYLACVVGPRITVCGAKPKYFSTPLRRFGATIGNVMKVTDREQFLSGCEKLLRAGEIILIYPEMGRNPDSLGEFLPWAAEVALRSNVSIIPCHISGTRPGNTGAVRVQVSEPLTPTGDAISLTLLFRKTVQALEESIAARLLN